MAPAGTNISIEPMMIDCSRAMIAPGQRLGRRPGGAPDRPGKAVERIERVGGEGERNAQHPDEELGAQHVHDGCHHALVDAVAHRREQVPPVEQPGAHVAGDVLEHVDGAVPERGVVEAGDVPEPHHRDVGDHGEERMSEGAGRAPGAAAGVSPGAARSWSASRRAGSARCRAAARAGSPRRSRPCQTASRTTGIKSRLRANSTRV